MYDLEKIRTESQLTNEQLAQLERQVREEFLTDELMFELHFVRVLESLRRGWITIEQALEEYTPAR